MRFLFVGTHPGSGGSETHFASLTRALADAGHEVVAVVCPNAFLHRALRIDPRIALHTAHFAVRNDLTATRAVLQIARQTRPDVIVGAFKREYWPVTVVARLVRTPVVLFSHLDQRLPWVMVRALPHLVHRLIAPSAYQRERLIARGLPPRSIAVLPNPIDTHRFRAMPALRETMRARCGFAPDDVVVGYAGRMEAGKGTEVLAAALEHAMGRQPRLRALWVGDGTLAPALRAAAAASPHHARHAWQSWTDDMVRAIAAMDVLVLPSVAPETFGRVLVEAQACGVPVVGSRLGGIPEAIREGSSGLLVPPGDDAALADALLALAAQPSMRRRMGWAGRRFVCEHFELALIVREFETLLGARTAPAGRRRA